MENVLGLLFIGAVVIGLVLFMRNRINNIVEVTPDINVENEQMAEVARVQAAEEAHEVSTTESVN